MSKIKTVFALILGLLFLGPTHSSAGPWPQSPAERAQVFAICAGRLSAHVDHERTIAGTVPEQFLAKQSLFKSLLNAVMPDAVAYGLPEAQAMDWLIHAKHNHSRLLMRADFFADTVVKQKARDAADAFIQECNAFVLS